MPHFKLGCTFFVLAVCSAAACGGSEPDGNQSPVEGDDEPVLDAGKMDAATVRKDAGRKDASIPKQVDAGSAALLKLPCEIEAIVKDKCGTCHGADPSAPMSLVTATDFQARAGDNRAMYLTAQTKINETDPRKAMPPASDDPLTESEKATLNAWFDAKAPAASSDKACATPDAGGGFGPAPESFEGLTCYKLLAHNGDGHTPLKVGIALDTYYAYVFEPPWKATGYGMLIRPVVDNKKALHHWLLFQDNVPGVPTGAVPQIGAHPTGQLMAVWAPGADPMDFRQIAKDEGGVGLEMAADTTYTVEFHYNSDDENALDASGVEICMANEKPKNIAAYSWLGYDNVGLPSTQWQGTCRPLASEPIHIISFMPHMHLNGIHMKGTVNRSFGAKEVVHDKPFDFNYQRSYSVDVVLNPGDSLTTDCTYAAPSVFGQPTNLEMCYLFAMAYPKGALASPDAWGTIAHGSSSCLGQ